MSGDDSGPNELTWEQALEMEERGELWGGERNDLVDNGPRARETHTNFTEAAPGEDVTQADILADVDRAESSLAFNGNLRQNGYNPASRITPENVADLERTWVVETDDSGLQTSPIVVPSGDGEPPVMYFSQGNQVVQAVDARTGDQYWEFRHAPDPAGSWGGRNRGVSVWRDKVYISTEDCHCIALDRYTGEVVWDTFYVADSQLELDPDHGRVGSTGPTLVYDGTVLIGQSGDNMGHTTIQGLDAETGEVRWQHKVGPEDEWLDETWKILVAGGAWMGASVDPEHGYAFFGTGNPMPMVTAPVRPGPNKHTNSIIAVDIETGEIAWTHQIFPNEQWDYDIHTQAYVFDMEVEGETRRVVGHDSKSAWTYVVDVETGRLVRRTDPWEIQEHRFGDWPDSRFLNLVGVGREHGGLCAPAPGGATQWPGDAYSPETGLRYIFSKGGGSGFARVGTEFHPEEVVEEGLWDYEPMLLDDTGLPATNQIQAIDPRTGKVVWRHETTGYVNGPGTTATGGNLVFGGEPGSAQDDPMDSTPMRNPNATAAGAAVFALHAETGERLWEDAHEHRPHATPVVWDDPEIDAQFLAIASNDSIVTYSLEAELNGS